MLNNYMCGGQQIQMVSGQAETYCRQYSGTEGVYTYTFEYQQRPECPVCGGEVTEMQEPSDETLEDFIEKLKAQPSVYVYLVVYDTPACLTYICSQSIEEPSTFCKREALILAKSARY